MDEGGIWFVFFIGIPTWFIVILGVLIFRFTRNRKREGEKNVDDSNLDNMVSKSLKILGGTILIMFLSILFSFGFAYLVVLLL